MATTKTRGIRIPDHPWDKAVIRAREEGTTVTELIRDWLEEYVDDDRSVTSELASIMARLKAIRTRLSLDNIKEIGE